MPYELFRTSYSHNPTQYSHIVKLTPKFYAHIFFIVFHKKSNLHLNDVNCFFLFLFYLQFLHRFVKYSLTGFSTIN